MGDLLTERKALVVPEPEPDSDSNQERKDDRERGKLTRNSFTALVTQVLSLSFALQLRGAVDFAISSFIIWGFLFLSLCLWGTVL